MFNPSASADVSELGVYDDFIELIEEPVKRFRVVYRAESKREGWGMPAYTLEQMQELRTGAEKWLGEGTTMVTRIARHPLRLADSRFVATHGYSRRLGLVMHALDRLYQTIPLDKDDPSQVEILDATIFLQSVLIHCYGAVDNLAQIWCLEADVRGGRDRPLHRNRIGFGPDRDEVRASLPDDLRVYLDGMRDWLVYLEDFRHSIAHRDPLYVPPKTLTNEEADRYAELDQELGQAILDVGNDRWTEIFTLQASLGRFSPTMVSSLTDLRPVFFHGQVIADLATIVELGGKVLDALTARQAVQA